MWFRQRRPATAPAASGELVRSGPAATESRYLPATREPQRVHTVARPGLPDRDLLHLVARADLHALEAIYDRQIEAAWAVALRFSTNAPAAEHAVARAFHGLWRTPEPRGRASLAGRLLSSVRREAEGSGRACGLESRA